MRLAMEQGDREERERVRKHMKVPKSQLRCLVEGGSILNGSDPDTTVISVEGSRLVWS